MKDKCQFLSRNSRRVFQTKKDKSNEILETSIHFLHKKFTSGLEKTTKNWEQKG